MKRFEGKIAVFICGPLRYVGHVTRRLEQVLAGSEYDCLYHIWKSDLGNKLRGQEETDISALQASPRTKVLIRQEPYSIEDFADSIGTQTGSNSSINATMGMFFSVNVLCHYLALMPDSNKYSHILRLRTDCAIISDDFVELLDASPEALTVSKSCLIPPDWVSDHIAFGTRETFARLWQYESMAEIYSAYQAAGRNPERTLAQQVRERGTGLRLNPAIVQYRDYHTVYYPPRDDAPRWVIDTLNAIGVSAFFESPSKYYSAAGTNELIARYDDDWRSKELLTLFREIHDKPDNAMSDISTMDIAGMLIRGYHDNPQAAEQLWKDIAPKLTCQALQQMLDECQRTTHQWSDGVAWLAETVSRRLQATRLYVAGCEKLRERAYAQAICEFEQALALNVVIPNLHYAMAAAFAQLGRYGSAKCSCQQELQIHPGHKPANDLLARLDGALKAAESTLPTR
jgi:tetratricopeptide (TPR) repeat protein